MSVFVSQIFYRSGAPVLRSVEQGKQVLNGIRTAGVRFASVKAAVLHEIGGKLKIENTESGKKLEKDEVRVKVYTCGINVSDHLIMNGQYEIKPKLPFIPCHEVAGKIIEVGPTVSKAFSVGARVLALSKQEFGGLAEEVVVSQSDLWTLPSSVSFKTSSALADNYTTALLGLTRRGMIKENDILLIGAGSGGLGLAAVDIAANVYKCKVIVICASEERAAVMRDKGAWAALSYDDKGVIKKVQSVTSGKGVQIVFDAVGGPVFETAVKCVAHEGRVIVAGHAIRQVPHIKVAELLPRSFSLMGVSLRNYLAADYKVYRQTVQDAIDMCEQDLVSPIITKKFKLSEANEAFQQLLDQDCAGKVVVEVED